MMRNEIIYEKLDRLEKMLRVGVNNPIKIDEAVEFTEIKKSTLFQMVSKRTIPHSKTHRSNLTLFKIKFN